MRLKSFFARSVDEALGKAALELGEDAMLVYARPAEGEAGRLGLHEVVCATPGEDRAAMPARRIEELRAGIAQALRDLEPRPAMVESSAGPAPSRATMIRSIRTDAALRRHPGGRSAVILAGPPGTGKTLTVVKLAAREILRGSQPPLIVSLDTRIGGAEALRAYAGALGSEFEHAWSAEEAAERFASASKFDLVLFDTPGVTAAEPELEDELGRLRKSMPEADVHLTLSAAAKEADLTRMVERFQRFRPTKLLFTRLDETGTFGPLWSEPVRWKIPVSFLTTGQKVTGDIEPATAVRLVDLALHGAPRLDARHGKARAATA